MSDKKTYAELQQQINDLQAQAEAVKQEEMSAVIEQMKINIAFYGITPRQLGFNVRQSSATPVAVDAGVSQRNKAAAKYKDPQSGATWSGNGRQPEWLKKALEGGDKTKEDFLIKN